jgi:hypothetical protein
MSGSNFKPLGPIMAKLRAGAIAGLEDAVEIIKDQAVKNAPEDTKDLKDSAQTNVKQRGGKLRGEVSFGKGLDDPRAVINHEKTNIHHDDGGPKYLERAMASELPKVQRVLQSEIRKRLR